MKRGQGGFSPAVIILIILVLAMVGFVAWRVNNADREIEQSQINSFAECKAANNPIMESYPERCNANGKTFTNPDQAVTAEDTPLDEADEWMLYTSAKGTYKVRLPDGWVFQTISDTENLYGGRQQALTYKSGTDATVATVEGGWDGASPVALYVPGVNYDQIVKEGDKQGEVTTKSGLKAEKYVYLQETEPEGIGYSKGTKVYNYYFGADGKYIQIQHAIFPGSSDQHERVEQMLATLQVN